MQDDYPQTETQKATLHRHAVRNAARRAGGGLTKYDEERIRRAQVKRERRGRQAD